MIYAPDDPAWLTVVQSFEWSAIRLEQQPAYLADVRSGGLDAWLCGATQPPGDDDWSQMVAAKVSGGASIRRVRVFEDTPTPYQQWIRWASAKNVEAGEQQRYLSRSHANSLGITADRMHPADFWVLDGLTTVIFHFDDAPGQLTSVEATLDSGCSQRSILRFEDAWSASHTGAVVG